MKKTVLVQALFLLVMVTGCNNKNDNDILKVITLNVRYDNPSDSLNPWSRRASIITGFIRNEKPDLLGMQEVLGRQYNYLDSVLKDYSSVGVGRDDGGKGGEMNPVFFRKDRFELIRTKTFWLSDTSEKAGSKSWGSGLPRIVTWTELYEKNTHEHFYFFNTHFAHDSDSARIMSSRLLLMKVDTISAGLPFVITGDLNMPHSSKGYEILTGPYESVPLLCDTYAITEKRPVGPAYTYNGFSDSTKAERIDYIFVRNGMAVLDHKTFIKKDRGIYISDHWPVMSHVSLKIPKAE